MYRFMFIVKENIFIDLIYIKMDHIGPCILLFKNNKKRNYNRKTQVVIAWKKKIIRDLIKCDLEAINHLVVHSHKTQSSAIYRFFFVNINVFLKLALYHNFFIFEISTVHINNVWIIVSFDIVWRNFIQKKFAGIPLRDFEQS